MDKVLQKDILALMLKNPRTVHKLKRLVRPHYFTIRAYKFLCKRIYKSYEKYDGELPSKKAIFLDINKLVKDDDQKKEYKKKLKLLFSRKVESPKHLMDEVYQWAEKQEFGRLLENSALKATEGKLSEAKELVKSSFLFDVNQLDFTVHSVLEEWKQRQRERKLTGLNRNYKQIRTELGPMDEYLMLRTNQSVMALIMGTSGVGKSITSINAGVWGLNAGCNVAHFVFENTARQTLGRYDSRLVKYPYQYLSNYIWSKKDLAIANSVMRGLRRRRKKALKVIHSPIDTVSVVDIEGLLKEIEIAEGWIPDLIIYDSGDHMAPSRRQESYRLSVSKTYKDIKRQSEIRDIPILSTTHAKASARGTRLRQESFSESYDKARLADVVLTISQTAEQEDDRQAEIWLDKWRDGEGRIGVLVDLLFSVMTLRFVERVELGGTDSADTSSSDG